MWRLRAARPTFSDMTDPRAPRDERLVRVLAELDRLVDWERRDRDASMRRGIEPAHDLCARLGHPERSFRCVHVAGTKGKGTTSALVAAALRRAGLHTGLYTSPHVSDVRERVQLDGELVDAGAFAAALARVLAVRAEAVREATAAAESTWFDVLTAAAFVCFADARVEWAVIECGLGGRLDSTNVVFGEVCVVTNIDLEHTAVLGATRALIAGEKVGIVKRGATLVTGVTAAEPGASAADDALRVVLARATELGVPVLRPEREAETLLARNLDLARLALGELGRRGVRSAAGVPLAGELLDEALARSAQLPARLERFRIDGTHVVLDGAHVASSVRQVVRELASDPELRGPCTCVLALGREKDAQAILKALRPRVDRVLCTTAASGPMVAAETLVREAAQLGMTAEKADDPAQALARALRNAGNERWVLVIGSFHLAGAVREMLLSRAKS